MDPELLEALKTWIPIVITVASAFVAATKTPKDNKVWKFIYTFIEILALNIGRAKEK